MKLLLDENLSPKLVRSLGDLFPGSVHVEDCGLGAADDEDIWRFAKENGFVIVSKDSDFYDRSALLWKPAEGHLVAGRKLHNRGNRRIAQTVQIGDRRTC